MSGWYRIPILTMPRIVFAFAVALAIDGLQVLVGPFGWLFLDEALDVAAMVMTSAAIGFHPLLLPTFIIKLIPVADWLPTWTGCTTVVVLLRRRAQAPPPPKSAQVLPPEMLPPPLGSSWVPDGEIAAKSGEILQSTDRETESRKNAT